MITMMKFLLMSVDETEGRGIMISQTENMGICPVLFIVFPAIKCMFGSFIAINIYCCYVCSVCLVAFVHVLIIWNVFCFINHADD